MGCTDLSSDEHRTAANDLKQRLTDRKYENLKGADRLRSILSKKPSAAYDPVTMREDEAKEIVKRAERFAEWAEETGRKLLIEGW